MEVNDAGRQGGKMQVDSLESTGAGQLYRRVEGQMFGEMWRQDMELQSRRLTTQKLSEVSRFVLRIFVHAAEMLTSQGMLRHCIWFYNMSKME